VEIAESRIRIGVKKSPPDRNHSVSVEGEVALAVAKQNSECPAVAGAQLQCGDCVDLAVIVNVSEGRAEDVVAAGLIDEGRRLPEWAGTVAKVDGETMRFDSIARSENDVGNTVIVQIHDLYPGDGAETERRGQTGRVLECAIALTQVDVQPPPPLRDETQLAVVVEIGENLLRNARHVGVVEITLTLLGPDIGQGLSRRAHRPRAAVDQHPHPAHLGTAQKKREVA